jgi:hypothetical protein
VIKNSDDAEIFNPIRDGRQLDIYFKLGVIITLKVTVFTIHVFSLLYVNYAIEAWWGVSVFEISDTDYTILN